MKKLFFAGLLFFTVSCGGSGEHSDTSANSDNDTTPVKGNSAGSNTIEMDTLHMDTSSQHSTGSGH